MSGTYDSPEMRIRDWFGRLASEYPASLEDVVSRGTLDRLGVALGDLVRMLDLAAAYDHEPTEEEVGEVVWELEAVLDGWVGRE
jgi:hypothetical protein